jgi:hypothetical protein
MLRTIPYIDQPRLGPKARLAQTIGVADRAIPVHSGTPR